MKTWFKVKLSVKLFFFIWFFLFVFLIGDNDAYLIDAQNLRQQAQVSFFFFSLSHVLDFFFSCSQLERPQRVKAGISLNDWSQTDFL